MIGDIDVKEGSIIADFSKLVGPTGPFGGGTGGTIQLGNLSIRTANEGTIAGNLRGTHSVDLQTTRLSATQVALGYASVISGGQNNIATGNYSTIGGGFNNATSVFSTVGGGARNNATGVFSTVGGGDGNNTTGIFSTIGGGVGNTSNDFSSTVGGGASNNATMGGATIGGGYFNIINGKSSFIGGGFENEITGIHSSIVGGIANYAHGNYSTVGGGYLNIASGDYSTVVGGQRNSANKSCTWAGGQAAIADHTGAFVWADFRNPYSFFTSVADNSFNIRATGGINLQDVGLQPTGPSTLDKFLKIRVDGDDYVIQLFKIP